MTRPRYTRVSLDAYERPLRAGRSEGAALIYARIRTSSLKRTIPSLLNCGVASLAELFGLPVAKTRRQLKELEDEFVLMDEQHRLVYGVGAVTDDPPRTVQAVKAFVTQLRELPASSVIWDVVISETSASLEATEYPQLSSAWTEALSQFTKSKSPTSGPVVHSAVQRNTHSRRHSTVHSTVDRTFLPVPVPAIRESEDPPPPSAARVARAWNRLPRPPFAAAMEADLIKAAQTIPESEFDTLVQQLAASKWVDGTLHTPPPLHRLLEPYDAAELRERIVLGEFASMDLRWKCQECGTAHSALGDCPPECRGCRRHHPVDEFCMKLRRLESEEQSQQRAATR